MVSVFASSSVDRGFESRSSQNKDYKIGIYCFTAKHAALRTKSIDWFTLNQDNMSEWRTSRDWVTRNQNNVWSGVTYLPLDCCFSELAL